MKRIYAAFIILTVGAVATALWFSPLFDLKPRAYGDNIPEATVLCYAPNSVVRAEFCGGQTELYSTLDGMRANVVKEEEIDDALIVYAYSPRVSAGPLVTADGKVYNVMAASRGGKVYIGTPVLEGSY